ncbi:MAG: phosphate acyltransferase PlsX [Ruminococcaceae bacterium]|nr:phosphate acyltransferase PlsX [Oscillospiraceae bacterium]
MIIAVDGYGGDYAPLEILKGSALAVSEMGVSIILTGDKSELEKLSEENEIELTNIEILNTRTFITMDDEARSVVREKSDSSMALALKLLSSGEADACVSAGPTGAYLMGATMIVKRIKGVKRPALGSVIPGQISPYMLIDCGANAEVRPEMLEQFGMFGSVYMKNIIGIKDPKVGLANNGTEESKGTELVKSAYELMKNSDIINFFGNIEGRDIPKGICEVVVADGFTGNLILKTIEGMAESLFSTIKSAFLTNAKTKIAAMMIKKEFKELKKRMDYSEYGGAPFIGLNKPVIKAHGSSNKKAIKNAIKQAITWSGSGINGEIEELVGK